MLLPVIIVSVKSFIQEKILQKRKLLEDLKYYKNEKERDLAAIRKLERIIENLEKEKQSILEADKALLQEKHIYKIFEVLEENNYPRLTKEKLARLWEIVPYYPPDWKLRKYVVRKRDNETCKKCGKDLSEGNDGDYGEVHHLIPLSMNGTNEIKNLVLVCKECHRKLHDELYNFDFSKYGYEPAYGISYNKLFPYRVGHKYVQGNIAKRIELLDLKEYQSEEPDTDLYYNISHWEDKI